MSPYWVDMKQAFNEYRGTRIKRSHLPYKITGRFLALSERPKTLVEVELAKRERLV